MRHLLICALGALGLSGCFWDSPADGTSLEDRVAQFRSGMVKVCGYMPTVASATAIITSGDVTAAGISAAAVAGCRAVQIYWGNQQQSLLSDGKPACPSLYGVCLEPEETPPAPDRKPE
jgi:hypothetical protein